MLKILKVELYNLLKKDSSTTLHPNSKVTILTGHNGVGKSTILASIHSSISITNSGEYAFPRSNWASQISFSDGFQLNHFKFSTTALKTVDIDFHTVIDQHSEHSNIQKTFQFFSQEERSKNKENPHLSTEGEKRELRSRNFMFYEIPHNDAIPEPDAPPTTNSVLYCDELFSFNTPLEQSEILEDLDIFSKKNTLDKTLYLLLKDLSAKSPANKEILEARKMLKELTEILEDDDVLSALSSKTKDKIKKIQHSALAGQHPNFIKEANIFFSTTGREVFLNEKNLLCLKIKERPKDIVEWFNLSKGEKTLLCLLLVAYLNGGDNTVFLLDEPDLSLHIQWQKQLLKSLTTLAPHSQFIISTHSPALIGHISEETIINVGSLIKKS